MLHSLYIVNDAGETVASISLSDFQIDEALFGGFLSAIQMFSQQMSGDELKEMSMENYRLIIMNARRGYVVTVHDRDDKDTKETSQGILKIVNEHMQDIITDDFLDMLRASLVEETDSGDRAKDWASKML